MRAMQRKYEETHPWITFKCDAGRFSHELWMNLGESRSKCEHIAETPMLPAVAEGLHTVYLAKGVLATTAIEGNTLTEKQVRDQLEGKLELPPSREYLRKEVQNIVEAVNTIAEDTLNSNSTGISVDEIKEYNRWVLDGLELNESVVPGEIRDSSFGVGSYRGAPAEDCEFLLESMCDWLNGADFCVEEENNRIVFGLLRAILAHLYIAWIHPFGDGNGRTARLIEFKILIAAGVPSPACQLLSNHYNLTRGEYYRQLDRASRSGGEIAPFIDYAVQGFVDGLKEQLNRIWVEQIEVVWRNFVHDTFSDKGNNKESATTKRRRHLLLDLSEVEDEDLLVEDRWVPINRVEEVSIRVAKEYANLTPKTLRRDVSALQRMNLVTTNKGLVRPNQERILAFLPLRKPLPLSPDSVVEEGAQTTNV